MMRMTRRAALLAVVFLIAASAAAQEVSTMRFYVVPKIGTGVKGDSFRAKYFFDMGVEFDAMEYGREDTMLVAALLTPTQHTTVAANLDVIAVPSPIDSNISAAALTVIQTRIDGLKIPALHFTTANTYREVVRIVGKACLLMQRYDGMRAKTFFDSGITLATTIAELTAGQRADLQAAAESFGVDTSGVTGGQTIRAVLRNWFAQMPSFQLGGEVF
jgi:hypothetical protein